MRVISVVVLAFSLLGASDYLIGNKLKVGKEFERAFALFCPMALSMLGMLVIAPAVGAWLTPFLTAFTVCLALIPLSSPPRFSPTIWAVCRSHKAFARPRA